MNAEVEDQIRAATRAEAETLREVRPLRLPAPGAQPAGPGSGARPRRARRFRPWIAPVAAAAAVIALAISLVLVRDIPNGRVVYRPGPAAVAGSVPRYYAATISVGRANGVIVNDTFTGARLATVKPPPRRSFGYVTAAADDRTFVVEAGPDTNDYYLPESWWYLLRIAPGTSHPARLTPLAIPDLQGSAIWALALSSSGRELAVGFGQTNRDPAQLRIYSVTTGKLERAWSTKDKTVFDAARAQGWGTATTTLTWVDDDRALAFSTQSTDLNESTFTAVTHDTLRLLDKSAGGSDLIADSRVIWSAQSVIDLRTGSSQLRCAGSPMLTADGKTIVCAAANAPPRIVPGRRLPPPEQWTLGWLAYSTSAPTAARTAAQLSVDAPFSNPAWADLVWTNSSGSTLIGFWTGGSYPGPNIPPAYRARWGVIADGEFRPLPTVPDMNDIFSIAW
ncbi:MAG TPA: hypothetical protein VH589_30405 [Trebonia sp.]|jgi:hypothetical protein